MKKSKDGPFELPEAFLKSLNEYTLGFIMCYVNDEGEPTILSKADNHCFYLGMISQLESFIAANKEVAKDCNIQEMMMPFEEREDDED